MYMNRVMQRMAGTGGTGRLVGKTKRKYEGGSGGMPFINPFITKGLGASNDDDDSDEDGGGGIKIPKLFGGMDSEDVYTTHNHIYFKTDVDEKSIDKLGRELDSLVHKVRNLEKKTIFGTFTPHPIFLHISTAGGSLFAGLLAYDKIKNSPYPVHTIIEGSVASAGSLMSMAGARRFITPSSYLLIHQLRSVVWGTFENIVDEKKNCTALMKRMINLYHENSNGVLSKRQIREFLKRDIFWSAEQSIEYGLVDEVYLG